LYLKKKNKLHISTHIYIAEKQQKVKQPLELLSSLPPLLAGGKVSGKFQRQTENI
jgi:hypothetical protein